MNSTYLKASFKETVATAAVLIASAAGIFGSVVNSNDARADINTVQRMETIVITAPRIETVRLDTIVVSAPREQKILIASN